MSDFKSEREKNIDNFINQLGSQDEWKNKINKKIKEFRTKYKKELEDYTYVYDTSNLYQLKVGGYIRYFNFNDEFRWGGILIKVYRDNKRDRDLMIIRNKNYNRYVVSFNNNYVFYKNHKTQSDNYRKLFLSFLDN
jgi:hypothetical protein